MVSHNSCEKGRNYQIYNKDLNCAHGARGNCCFSYPRTLAFHLSPSKFMKDMKNLVLFSEFFFYFFFAGRIQAACVSVCVWVHTQVCIVQHTQQETGWLPWAWAVLLWETESEAALVVQGAEVFLSGGGMQHRWNPLLGKQNTGII